MFRFLGNDVLVVDRFLSEEQVARITRHFDQAPFEELDLARVPENVRNYYHGFQGPEIYWLKRDIDREVDQVLFGLMKEIIDRLGELYVGLVIQSDEGYRYNRYREGGGYKLHVDRSHMNRTYQARTLSVVINLNQDFEGGELHFPRQDLKLKLGMGDLCIFPSTYTHPHEVLPVTAGVRKSIVSWLN
jgi:prolyl 4-hydroxylase